MKFRTTILLLIVVMGLGAYLWYVDRGRPSTEERQRVAKRLLREFDPEKVTDLRVSVAGTNASGERTAVAFHLQRDVSGWRVITPLNFPANEIAVRRILDMARSVDQEAVIRGTNYAALDRAAAGLDEPDIVATFVMPATAFTMRVGGDVPGQWAHYVEIEGEPAVYFVPSHFKENLMLATDSSKRDVRRRRVFAIRDYQVSTISMETPVQTVELRKKDGIDWVLTQPVADAADAKVISALLEKLEKLELSAFVEEATNFGQPVLTLTVVEGMASQRLQLGAMVRGMYDAEDAPPSEYLARRIEYPQYFTVRRADVEALMQPAEYYRSKRMITWHDDETPVELRQSVGGDTLALTYNTERRAWELADVATPLIDEAKLDSFVYDWLELSVTGFVAAAEARAALTSVWINVSARFEGSDTPRAIALSRPVNGLVYAERSPGVFVTCDEQAVRALAATDEVRFLKDALIELAGDDVTEVAIAREGARWQLVQRSNVWSIMHGDTVKDSTRDVAGILGGLLPLQVVRYVEKAGVAELARYGLQPAEQEVTFTASGGEMTTLLVGGACDTTNRYVMVQGQPYVAVMTAARVEALEDVYEVARESEAGR